MKFFPKELSPIWRAFEGYGEADAPVDIKPDLNKGFLSNFGKKKFNLKQLFQKFGKQEKEKEKLSTKSKDEDKPDDTETKKLLDKSPALQLPKQKRDDRNNIQQVQRRQSYRPLPLKEIAADDQELHPEMSSAEEKSNESSVTTSVSTPTPSESTSTPSESTPTPSESITISESTSTSSETEDEEGKHIIIYNIYLIFFHLY
ncbi:hypothetical protein NPIL_406281 [Nephila pilipes]|uniref:Uncharacterized protein n=1 Tax=Nephila pilipes TaxID=299642 RepID=A0A8X6QHJ6_NEPPI|nr:hypothetical protein NPIL_406281 [Nephila pilipes]